MEKKQLIVRVPVDLLHELKAFADELGITQSAALILILRKFFVEE